jgi:hypothetical protein
MKKYILLLAAALFITTGCDHQTPVNSPETGATVAKDYSLELSIVRSGVSFACTTALNVAVSSQDRINKADMIYACAKAIRTLAGGNVPTPVEVAAVITLWMPDKAHWANLASSISRVYAGAFSNLHGNPLLAVKFLEQIALGCEESAGSVIRSVTGI